MSLEPAFKNMHQHLLTGEREKRAGSGYVLKVIKAYLCCIFDMRNKIKLELKLIKGAMCDIGHQGSLNRTIKQVV